MAVVWLDVTDDVMSGFITEWYRGDRSNSLLVVLGGLQGLFVYSVMRGDEIQCLKVF